MNNPNLTSSPFSFVWQPTCCVLSLPQQWTDILLDGGALNKQRRHSSQTPRLSDRRFVPNRRGFDLFCIKELGFTH
ncbi:hypothetical protein M5689_006933 [Euphorbia peplus]|nr:hypothetical protein M5689_006933 [Euphorbia peplus]